MVSALPLPTGLSLVRAPDGGQIQLKLEPFFASKLRRLFGYVAEIALTDGEGTDAPAQIQIVTKIPWRYGRTASESPCSWVLARVQSFVSRALVAPPAQIVKLGSCVSGFADPSSGDSRSCHLVGWDTCSIDEWKAVTPTTAPAGFDLAVNRSLQFWTLFPLEYG